MSAPTRFVADISSSWLGFNGTYNYVSAIFRPISSTQSLSKSGSVYVKLPSSSLDKGNCVLVQDAESQSYKSYPLSTKTKDGYLRASVKEEISGNAFIIECIALSKEAFTEGEVRVELELDNARVSAAYTLVEPEASSSFAGNIKMSASGVSNSAGEGFNIEFKTTRELGQTLFVSSVSEGVVFSVVPEKSALTCETTVGDKSVDAVATISPDNEIEFTFPSSITKDQKVTINCGNLAGAKRFTGSQALVILSGESSLNSSPILASSSPITMENSAGVVSIALVATAISSALACLSILF